MFKNEVCNTESFDLSRSVLKDFLDQLADLKKRVTNIKSMDDHEPPVGPIDVTEYDSDSEETVSTMTLGSKKDFLIVFLKRELINLSKYQVTERTLGETKKADKKVGKMMMTKKNLMDTILNRSEGRS